MTLILQLASHIFLITKKRLSMTQAFLYLSSSRLVCQRLSFNTTGSQTTDQPALSEQEHGRNR